MTSVSEKSDQELLTAFESTSQISNDSNSFKQTTVINKPQSKVNWAIQSTMSNINGQKEKELSLLRWILLTIQPLFTVIHKAYIEHMHIIDPLFTVFEEKKIRMMIACSYGYNRNKLKLLLKTA
ncbi:hypothetical protein RIR_jg32264.t1 [Rhizophagus irregularis DAOM 181602=DAOM 197198]|nr:hypothetical protein RIR_jg32264.t1 [Rhizophagus irregularis DAOM 181602=DAOM 197198]